MRKRVTNGLRVKSFAVRVVIGRNKLQDKVVEVRSMREFKQRLGNLWLAVF